MGSLARRLALLGVLACLPAAAEAHAQLRGAAPPVGGTVAAAPARVEILFSEAVEPRFSTILVTDGAGRQVDRGDVRIVGGDPNRLAVSLNPLAAGEYRVVWHALSVDTHRTEGSYSFRVGP